MKKSNLIFAVFAFVLMSVFASCSEEDNTVEEFPDWRNRNEAYFSDIWNTAKLNSDGNSDGSWKTFLSYALEDTIPTTSDDYIAVKVLREGTGSGCPMFTDSVKINYRGRLIPSDGFATALQHMHIGDYWRVYIPYTLGYGSSDSDVIPAYSTLIFDVELVAYYRAGVDVPESRAVEGEWITE